MKHVFISYVHEDQEVVSRLCSELSSRGVEVWLDREEILPGHDWREAIRIAIREGAYFIACFSKNYINRERTHMNEELNLAIDEIRQRATNITWFIPVKFSQCQIPERSIGAGENLTRFQWVDLFSDWQHGIKKIIRTMDISPLSELEEYMLELTKGLVLDQWQLLAKDPGPSQTNTYYALKNLITQKSIEYGYVKRGIKLVWGQDSLKYIIAFEMPDTPEKHNLRFGNKIAIHMKDRGYIIIKGRGYGINLAWSKSPKYQWIIGPIEKGNRVISIGNKFSLFSTIAKDNIVHFPRSNGVSLRWKTDCRWGYKDGHSWSKGKALTSIQNMQI